jgi:hypothetical protein
MLTKKEIEKLLQDIYSGETSLFNLPENIFEFTFAELINSVESGFGGGVGSFPAGSLRATRAIDYRQNIFTFSGAKTFNEIKDLSLYVFDENGIKRSFKEFRERALEINNKYNVDWLRTEQDTAFGMAQSAEKWMEIEEDKELFPLLKYETAGDEKVRGEHRDWDQLVFPVDHEFWNTRMPINDWGCRCSVTQLDEGKASSLKGVPKNESKMFSNNPGKVSFIFDEKVHPYYKVEKRFKPMMDDNFGFKMPEK